MIIEMQLENPFCLLGLEQQRRPPPHNLRSITSDARFLRYIQSSYPIKINSNLKTNRQKKFPVPFSFFSPTPEELIYTKQLAIPTFNNNTPSQLYSDAIQKTCQRRLRIHNLLEGKDILPTEGQNVID